MQETLNEAPGPTAPVNSGGDYSRYKEGVDRADEHKRWLRDKSLKGILKRAFVRTIDTALIVDGKERDNRLSHAEKLPLQAASEHLQQNGEAIKLDAVQEAKTKGIELNLPESGLPDSAVNIIRK